MSRIPGGPCVLSFCGLLQALFLLSLVGCDCSGGLEAKKEGPCKATEPKCPQGQECVNGLCKPKSDASSQDASRNLDAPEITTDQGDIVPFSAHYCDDSSDCAGENICLGGICQRNPCADVPADFQCGTGTSCLAVCVKTDDPCSGVTCEDGQRCISGQCTPACLPPGPCDGVTCPADQHCDPSVRRCVATAGCSGTCPGGKTCHLACAAPNPCDGILCGEGEICQNGTCHKNLCAGVKCTNPVEVCVNGGCIDTCNCGGCKPGFSCVAGKCECAPNCSGKACGEPDGCGKTCNGPCPEGQKMCLPKGEGFECGCVPNCKGKACGASDGCAGTCKGDCAGGLTCVSKSGGYSCCDGSCAGKKCGDLNGCGKACDVETCPSHQECKSKSRGKFECACAPDCEGASCNDDDGCGAHCKGSCSGGDTCVSRSGGYQCCDTSCDGKACGELNGCGDACKADCGGGLVCRSDGAGKLECQCDDSCSGKSCGEANDCGDSCNGDCPGGATCVSKSGGYSCCSPDCSGKACGDDDGCGHSCNVPCGSDKMCEPARGCVCDSSCAGKSCGEKNACGDVCKGPCPGGDMCEGGKCVPSPCTPACDYGYSCSAGQCLPICAPTQTFCGSDMCCNADQKCVAGACVSDLI